ncbi:MAG: hypothetical protein ISR58_20370, partial [Anaerolineales bacterium]|nr:hypothetical protein [Anaerolineales bacterium]
DIDEYELPAELEPSPPLPVRPTPKPITKQPWFWPAIGIGIIGLGAQIFSGGSKNDPLAVTQTALAIQQTQTALVYVPQQPETITPTEAPLLDLPTSMPLPTQTSTVVAKEQKVRSAAKWPLLLLEPFNNNDNEWLEGEIDDEYAQITMTINGTYSWEISSKQGFIWWVYPTSEIVGDFYLAVEVINPSSNRDAPNGLIFRISENGDHYYYFEVRDTQLFSVWANDRGEWAEIVPYTTSTAIRPSDNNHLEIIAQGDEHFFFINNELVAEKTILSSSQGYTGVAAGLDYEDEHSTIVFDNFELRAP